MKLKKGDYVNIKSVSKEIFDACVAVAVASGFKIDSNDTPRSIYPILSIIDGGSICSCDRTSSKNKLTINEWLFSLAPDWADTIDYIDGEYFYRDDSEFIKIGCNLINKYEISNEEETAVIIATRDTVKKEWEPQVGEDVIFDNQEVKVEHVKGNLAWVEKGDDSDLVNLRWLKPLPTEEEALRAFLLDSVVSAPNKDAFDSMAKALIKAGYKKC